MPPLRYEVVDVFAERPYEGNPLAVVFDADGLPPAAMQAVARELGLSETVFVLADDGPADARLRIFTPTVEVPFAGHPLVGAAWVLRRAGRVRGDTAVLDVPAGLVTVTTDVDGATLAGPPGVVAACGVPGARAAGVLGVAADAVAGEVRVAGCGLLFAYAAVREDAVPALRPDLPGLATLLAELPVPPGAAAPVGLVAAAWSAGDGPAGLAVRVRVFVPGAGIAEDPATGSAALGLAWWLRAIGVVAADGPAVLTVRQGEEVARPSRLDVVVGRGPRVTVRGRVEPVAVGELRRP